VFLKTRNISKRNLYVMEKNGGKNEFKLEDREKYIL